MKCNYVRQQKENKMTRAEERELQRVIRKKFYEELEKSFENVEEPSVYEEWLKGETSAKEDSDLTFTMSDDMYLHILK